MSVHGDVAARSSRYVGRPTDEGLRDSCTAFIWLPSTKRLYATDMFQMVVALCRNTWSTVAAMFLRTRPLVCSPRAVS